MWRKILFLASSLVLASCSSSLLDKGRAFHTQSVSWSQVSGWQRDDFREVLPAVLNSCTKAPPKNDSFLSRA